MAASASEAFLKGSIPARSDPTRISRSSSFPRRRSPTSAPSFHHGGVQHCPRVCSLRGRARGAQVRGRAPQRQDRVCHRCVDAGKRVATCARARRPRGAAHGRTLRAGCRCSVQILAVNRGLLAAGARRLREHSLAAGCHFTPAEPGMPALSPIRALGPRSARCRAPGRLMQPRAPPPCMEHPATARAARPPLHISHIVPFPAHHPTSSQASPARMAATWPSCC